MSSLSAHGPLPMPELRGRIAVLQQALVGQLPGTIHPAQLNALLAVLPVLDTRIEARQVAEAWPQLQVPPEQIIMHLCANLGYQVRRQVLSGGPARAHMADRLILHKEDVWLLPAGSQPVAGRWQVWQGRSQSWQALSRSQLSGATCLHMSSVPAGGLPSLWQLSARFRPLLGPVVAMSLAIQCLGLMVPVLTMLVYDRVISGQTPVGFVTLVVGILLVLASEAVLRHLRGRLLVWLAIRWDAMSGTLVLGQLLHLPAGMIEQAAVSNQLSRLKGFEVIRETATSPVVLGILDLPFVLLLLVALAWLAGPLVQVPLALIGVYLLLIRLALPWIKNVLTEGARAQEHRQRLLLETCRQQQSLRADGLTAVWQQRLAVAGHQAGLASGRGNHMQHVLETFSQLSGSLAGLATLAYGIHLVLAGQLSAGALVAAMMLVWRVLAPLSLLCTSLPRLIQLHQTLIQLQRLLRLDVETPPLAIASRQRPEPVSVRGHVQFHQVGLRYAREHEPVMAGLSFTVTPGQLVVITGRNGSGKSTLLKLILGLYQPQSGSVRLDGLDIRQWQPERLRQQLAYLPQQPELFSGTVADNLRLVDPLATDARLWTALDHARAADDVRRLSGGLQHAVSGASLPLSLQYQLSLARLFLNPAPLVLCDELPNALMSGPVGQSFRQWLAGQKGRNTVIMVSHRHDFMPLADLAIGLRIEQAPLIGAPHHVLAGLQAEQAATPGLTSSFTPTPLITVNAA